MSIRPRRTKKRGVVFDLDFTIGNQRVTKTLRSKQEAREYEVKLRADYNEARHAGLMGFAPKKTYGEAVTRWLEADAPDSMLYHIQTTLYYLDSVLLINCVKAAADMKTALLSAGKSPLTVNRKLAVVKRVLNLAYREWEWLDRPLADRIIMLSERGTERHVYLSAEQVAKLVKHCECQTTQRVIMIAAYTGLRRSEILRLSPENIKPGMILLDANTKTGRPRSIPYPKFLAPILEKIPINISARAIRHWFEKARNAAGMKHVNLHDLRHTYASFLTQDPRVPTLAVKEILGHSSLQTTSRYAHLDTSCININEIFPDKITTK